MSPVVSPPEGSGGKTVICGAVEPYRVILRGVSNVLATLPLINGRDIILGTPLGITGYSSTAPQITGSENDR